MKKPDPYKSTIEAYRKMGKSYVEAIKELTPSSFNCFCREVVPGGSILEIGCAGGRDAKKFVELGFDYTGIDVVEEFLSEARKNAPTGKFQNMDLLRLAFPNESFDGIWANAVLLHVKKEDIPSALTGFYNVLKKGGKLCLGLKSGSEHTYGTDKLSNEKRLMILFGEDEIKEFVENCGLKINFFEISPDDAGRKDINWIRLIAEK